MTAPPRQPSTIRARDHRPVCGGSGRNHPTPAGPIAVTTICPHFHPRVKAEGLAVEQTERFKLGSAGRVVARKPH